MNPPIRYTAYVIVLCQLFASQARAQIVDSTTIYLELGKGIPSLTDHSKLGGIFTGSIGAFNSFRKDSTFGSFFQPNVGFELLAEPGGSVHFLIGAKVGLSNPLSTEITLGFRLPIHDNSDLSTRIFTDLQFVFFDDMFHPDAPGTGLRGAFGARTSGPIDLEYRIAAEFRGQNWTAAEGYKVHNLWWVGAEVGIAFNIGGGAATSFSRRDSIRAALKYIATSSELDDFDKIKNNSQLEFWVEDFWKRRDPTPGTYLNELRLEYERRIKTANLMFSSPHHLGVMTDPGRVWLLYGKPDDVESGTSMIDERYGYVMWIYRHRITTEPIAVFLFQVQSPLPAEQIFSNVPGELSGILPAGLPITMTRWIQ